MNKIYFDSPEIFSGKKGPYWACRDTDPLYTHAYIREGPSLSNPRIVQNQEGSKGSSFALLHSNYPNNHYVECGLGIDITLSFFLSF